MSIWFKINFISPCNSKGKIHPSKKTQMLEKKQMPLKCTEDTSYLGVGDLFSLKQR